MKIIRLTGLEGLSEIARKWRIMSWERQGKWTKVYYKIPHGRKTHVFFVLTKDCVF